jgi:predicted transcriptional regulator
MGLKGPERLVLELVDGKRDIKELIDISGLSEISILRALFALYSAGFVRKYEPTGSQYRTQYL